jgi:hypothetical protein
LGDVFECVDVPWLLAPASAQAPSMKSNAITVARGQRGRCRRRMAETEEVG